MEVLTICRLFGKDKYPGDKLSKDELSSLSERQRDALISQGIIGDKAKLTPAVKKATTIRNEAAAVVKKAEQAVAEMQANLEKAQAEQSRLFEARRPFTVNAARGDSEAQAALKKLAERTRLADLAQRDALMALDEVKADLAKAEQAKKQAEHEANALLFQDLAEARLKNAKAAETYLKALADLFQQLDANSRQIAAIMGPGRQLGSRWRIRGAIVEHLGTWVEQADYPRDWPGLEKTEKQLIEQMEKTHAA